MTKRKVTSWNFSWKKALYPVANSWVAAAIQNRGLISNQAVDQILTSAEHFCKRMEEILGEDTRIQEDATNGQDE